MSLRLLGAVLCLVATLAAAPAAAQPDADVVLRSGDALKVAVWREPDLSGEFQVDENGEVTLPMLGPVAIAGRPISRVREDLLAAYARQLRNPSVTVVALRRINVLGDVVRPGVYTVDPTVALSDLLALAGGANSIGDLRRIRLVREGQTLHEQLQPGASLTTMDVRSGDQIFVGRRSWMSRNSGILLSSIITTAVSVTASLIIANN